MTKHSHPKKVTYQPAVIAAVVVVVAVCIMVAWPKKKVLAPTTTNASTDVITITTDDGIKLAATEKTPVRNALSPAVIFLHQYGQDRHEWDKYLQQFVDQGFVVLSYDMRGFGDSRLPSIPPDQNVFLGSLIKDVPAVIAYVKQQPFVDPEHINLVGASIGADVAWQASGSNVGIYRTVLLSPVTRGTVFDGHDIPNFTPAGVYGISSETESTDLATFMKVVKDPQQKKIVSGNDHGVDLLPTAGVLNAIFTWLKS